MEELAATGDINQYDVPNGRLSCTASAVCCARLFLDRDGALTRDDLHRVVRAGAHLYRKWWDGGNRRQALQCWADVVRTFPDLGVGWRNVFEANGAVPTAPTATAAPPPAPPLPPGHATFDDAVASLSAGASPRAGILTARGGSYGVMFAAPHWYVFDSHGTAGAGRAARPATLRRTADETAFRAYLLRDLMPHARGAEFQLALFERSAVPPRPSA